MFKKLYYINFEMVDTKQNILGISKDYKMPIYFVLDKIDLNEIENKKFRICQFNIDQLNELIIRITKKQNEPFFKDNILELFELQEELIKKMQYQILLNVQNLDNNIKSLNEIYFLVWKANSFEKILIPNLIDINKIFNDVENIQNKKNKIDSFKSIDILELCKDPAKQKHKKIFNNAMVNVLLQITNHNKYEWIFCWKCFDTSKVKKLQQEKIKKYNDAIYDYMNKKSSAIYEGLKEIIDKFKQ